MLDDLPVIMVVIEFLAMEDVVPDVVGDMSEVPGCIVRCEGRLAKPMLSPFLPPLGPRIVQPNHVSHRSAGRSATVREPEGLRPPGFKSLVDQVGMGGKVHRDLRSLACPKATSPGVGTESRCCDNKTDPNREEAVEAVLIRAVRSSVPALDERDSRVYSHDASSFTYASGRPSDLAASSTPVM